MKTSLKHIAFVAVAIAGMTSIVSCSDDTPAEKDRGLTPVIKYARSCDPTKADSLIVSGSLGQRLAFVGNNLGDVCEVWFNDQKAKLNPTLVTSNTIIVDIPNIVPGEVSNIAKFITSTGKTLEYPFSVTVPKPRIDAMSCEYAKAGSTVTFTGNYFCDDPNVPLEVIFPGNKKADIRSIQQDELTVVVPEGAPEGEIAITSIYGTGTSSFHYKDTRGMLFDFDGITGLGTDQSWHPRPIMEDSYSISGKYTQLGDGSTEMSADGGWNDGLFAFEYWPGAWTDPVSYPTRVGQKLTDFCDFSDFQNLSLKFELCIPDEYAWQAGAMQCIFAGIDLISFGNAGVDVNGDQVAGCNNQYYQNDYNPGYPRGIYRPWTASSAFSTGGEWITVTLPISDFKYDQAGANATQALTAKSFTSLVLFINSGGVEGVACKPMLKIDNIRVVPN
jgi:hypothetical protein